VLTKFIYYSSVKALLAAGGASHSLLRRIPFCLG
jgi:hypothetical protein